MSYYKSSEIAIIGMSGRFPDADNLEEFWQNLKNAKECIKFYSDEDLRNINKELLENPYYVKAQGILKNIKRFDAKFFSYTPSEAERIDPQHRIFLECAWESLENAGYTPGTDKKNIGVYAGVGENNYLSKHILSNLAVQDTATELQLTINNSKDFLSTRVAYKLNLTGPALTIQTACSTSLVAIHQACLALQAGECDMALAGAVSFLNLEKTGYLYQPGMILSPDGKCRAFDASAQGTVSGQGVGIVVLKPVVNALKDGDHIYAIIKSSAINNDGSQKMGFSAPSSHQQAEVIKLTHKKADIMSDTITYIEAHGTGTPLGDPIEIAGLTQAFNTDRKQYCAVGSVKTNLGHLDTAAGVAGLIKTVLCLYHKTLVPSLHYTTANSQIKFENTPFYVNTELKHWECSDTPRRAGVSSFGVGGTNAHILLEESPTHHDVSKLPQREHQIISISANTKTSLDITTENLSSYLLNNRDKNLENIAYTLHSGRKKFKYGTFVICSNNETASLQLRQENKEYITHLDRSIIFMFSGQGSQCINMGRKLYESEPNFKLHVEQCLSIIKNMPLNDFSAEDFLGCTEKINQTVIAQPALFIIEYALAKYLINLGIKPVAMIGHSIGEYVAACLSGVFSLEDALKIIILRGKLLQNLPQGKMLSVLLSNSQIQTYVDEYQLDIAAINTPDSCVVSGKCEKIEKLTRKLDSQEIPYKHLNTSHAFHSQMLDPILENFHLYVSEIKLNLPNCSYVSNLTGTWIDPMQITKPDYWVSHLRKTVLFSEGITCLLKNKDMENKIFLELGPGDILTNLTRKHLHNYNDNTLLFSLLKSQSSGVDDSVNLFNVLGNLYARGVNINWDKFYNTKQQRIPLPTYSFEKEEFWISLKQEPLVSMQSAHNIISSNPKAQNCTTENKKCKNILNSLQEEIIKIWQDTLGVSDINISDNFFNLGGDSLLAIQLNSKINKFFKLDITLKEILENATFYQLSSLIQKKLSFVEAALSKKESSFAAHIINLKKEEGKYPFFAIHPISGYIFCYRDMVDYMNTEQAVYGIQSPWLEKNCDIAKFSSIEAIAGYYVNSIFTVQPKGPFCLFGSSFGGLIAYEIAQQLKNKKHEVSLLAMADTGRPNHPLLKITNKDELLLKLIELFRGAPISPQQRLNLSEAEKIGLILESMKLHNLPISQHQKIFDQINVFCQAMLDYHPKPYSGKVIFFDPKKKSAEYGSLNASSTWDEFVKGDSKVYEIPGDHFSMILKPNVEPLAHLLQLHINDLNKFNLKDHNNE